MSPFTVSDDAIDHNIKVRSKVSYMTLATLRALVRAQTYSFRGSHRIERRTEDFCHSKMKATEFCEMLSHLPAPSHNDLSYEVSYTCQ